MRIVERYPLGLSFARGRGVSRILFPLRLVLAAFYGAVAWAVRPGGPVARRRPLPRGAAGKRPFVVSIGNMVAGGGGKTPCVIALAEAIRERGGTPAVVTRGYGGALEGRGPRVAGGAILGVELVRLFGDEAMLYRSRGIPVVTDANRWRGAGVAADLFAPTHILLDDAFQNHSLAKDFDILLLDASRPFDGGLLLPAGFLREVPGAARRADAIIFTRACDERVPAEAERAVAGKPVFFARHEPVYFLGREGRREPLSIAAGRRVVLFSGIAAPASFEACVVDLGAEPLVSFRFEDHRRYRPRDVREIMEEARGEALVVTTEKDFWKVSDLFPAETSLLALAVEMRISGIERLCALLGLGA